MNLSVYYQNVNGLRTKIQSVMQNILSCSYDVICFTETRLNSGIYDAELFNNDYVVYRRDRDLELFTDKVDGGGCLIAIKRRYSSYRVLSWEKYAEEIWVCIKINNNQKLYVNVPYIYPYANHSTYENYFENLNHIVNTNNSSAHFLIVGDFNLPHIQWAYNNELKMVKLESHNHSISGQCLVESMSFTGLNQFNFVHNHNNRLLDLVLSTITPNNLSAKSASEILCSIDSHHPPLELLLSFRKIHFIKEDKVSHFDYKHCDYDIINAEINELDWFTNMLSLSVEQSTSYFYSIINNIIERHVPVIHTSKKNYPEWYSTRLLKLLELKEYCRKTSIKSGDIEYRALFSKIRKMAKHEQKQCYSQYISSIEKSVSANPKSFWSYCKKIKKANAIPSSMHLNNVTSCNVRNIGNLFAEYFKSVYNPANNIAEPVTNAPTPNCTSYLEDLHISEEEVLLGLTQLDVNKGCGPDQIPPLFFKNVSHTIYVPLFIIFNKSLNECVFPSLWKVSKIIPIFKKGDSTDIKNYRPISILNCCAKIFERILHNKLFAHVKHMIAKSQHGFFKTRSTLTNLLSFTDYVFESLEGSAGVDVIYTDFSKAFDKVNHKLLLAKLYMFGINYSTIQLIQSYLTNRIQYVQLNSICSDYFNPTSGVPQGSILGPLLFIIFINDITRIFQTNALLFADDLKIFTSVNSQEDCRKIQEDLNNLYLWCKLNDMELNIGKCQVLRIKPRVSCDTCYHIHNNILEHKQTVRDLGITMNTTFNFNSHITEIVNNSLRILGFVMRVTADFTNCKAFISLYTSLVRSSLEYLSPIWNPNYVIYADCLERVQRKFTRFLNYKQKQPKELYPDRLARYSLYSLEIRRKVADETTLYKILHSIIDSELKSKFILNYSMYNTRNPCTFRTSTCRTNYRKFSPLFRLQTSHNNDFNNLNLSIGSLALFKKEVHYNLNLNIN